MKLLSLFLLSFSLLVGCKTHHEPTQEPTPAFAFTSTPAPKTKPQVVAAPAIKPTPKPPVAAAPALKPRRPVLAAGKRPIRHIVVKGETLWGIARKYRTSVEVIQRANGLKDQILRVGMTLLIYPNTMKPIPSRPRGPRHHLNIKKTPAHHGGIDDPEGHKKILEDQLKNEPKKPLQHNGTSAEG